MRLDWHINGEYEDAGGASVLREAVQEALTVLPREHLRQLEALIVVDEDPKGKALGIWRQDHLGVAIELYLQPHVAPLLPLPAPVRAFALRLHLAYTIFHEVGHHVTRFLNRRATRRAGRPWWSRRSSAGRTTTPRRRLGRLVEGWLRPGGRADTADGRRALFAALRALRLDAVVPLASDGTKLAAPSS